jgi:hypothetical protein
MSETVPTKAAAEACNTNPKLLRQFLRASKDYQAVGSGGRYAFEVDELPALKTRFDAWLAEREAAAKARAEADKAAQDEKPADEPTPADDEADEPTEEKPAPAKPARGRKPNAA